jgi:simple sugar transport system permease protein
MRGQLAAVLRAVLFVLVALAVCGVIFACAGYSALDMFSSILDGAVLRPGGWRQALRWALPLFITAAGVGLSFRCGYFNIGAQGQFYVGAICATFVATWLDGAPAFVLLPLAFVAGLAGGALWALWPGLLRLSSGTDEVITTLMGNFIAGLLLVYVTTGPLKDPSGSGQQSSSRPLAAAYRISTSTGLSPTILALTILVGVAMWLLVNRTAFGVLAGLAGRNPTMVRWQGAKVWRLGLASFLISGGLAGLAGTIEVFGPNGRLIGGFLPTHGFTAVLIALVAYLSVAGEVVAALFFGGLASAALYLPIMAGLPAAAIDIVNAAIALFITARPAALDRLFRSMGG